MWVDLGAAAPPDDDAISGTGLVGVAADGDRRHPLNGSAAPQAFLVRSGPAAAPLRTHFHDTNQFQYVVCGGGKLGRHAIAPGHLHYADRLTTYGPLTAGPHGLSYITMRATTDTGISYMPDSQAELRVSLADSHRASERRSLMFDLTEPRQLARTTDLRSDPDGLLVRTVTIAPTQSHTVEITGAGAFLLVVDGSVVDEGGNRHHPGAIRWVAPARVVAVHSSSGGAMLGVLQLPTPNGADGAVC